MTLLKKLFLVCLLALPFAASESAMAQSPQYDLLKAVDKSDIEELEKQLREGVSPNTRQRSSGTPALILAADKPEILKILLDHDANPNIADRKTGQTVLMLRATVGDVSTIQVLLEYGADPNKADRAQETALIKAVRNKKFRAAEALLEAGANPNVQDLTGKTALEYAKISRSRRIIRLLEEAGAF